MPAFRYLVNDVDASIAFFNVLGFKLTDRWGPPFAIMKKGSAAVWLSGPGTSARKKLRDGSVPEPGGWNRLVVEVKSMEKVVARLDALDCRFRNKPIKGPGGLQALVQDPSGNVVELFQPLGDEK